MEHLATAFHTHTTHNMSKRLITILFSIAIVLVGIGSVSALTSVNSPTLWKFNSNILSPVLDAWKVNTSTISGVFAPSNGGTGTSTAPSSGDILIGNSSGTYSLVSSSSLPYVATETDPIWTSASSSYLLKSGGTMSGDINMNGANLVTDSVKANTSGGMHFYNDMLQDIMVLGAGSGIGASFNGTIVLPTLQDSKILATDITKGVTTLDTATYPNLTELSYLKDVTGPIQTQFGDYLLLDGTRSMTGSLSLATGTTSIAPIKFTSGPLKTTSGIGNVEFFGDDYYLGITTPVNGSQYPPAHSTTYVKATSVFSANYVAHFATNPAISLVGTITNQSWLSSATTNQSFHIDLGEKKVIDKIYYENLHNSGSNTTNGVENFTFWGTNDATAFATTSYSVDTNWTQLTTSQSTFDIHVASNTTDPKYITATNTTGYRYYRLKFADNYGGATYMGVRRIELQATNNYRKNIVTTDGSPLTATYLPYASTNGRLKDTGLYWDATNTRLGIGTTNPLAPLDVLSTSELQSKVTLARNITGTGWQTAMDAWFIGSLRPIIAFNYTTGKVGYIAGGGTQGHTLMTGGRSVFLDSRDIAGTTKWTTASASEDQTNAALDMVGTWNNAAQKFWGIRFDYTDTASAATTLLMDLQVGNATKFSIRKDGMTKTVDDVYITTSTKGIVLTSPDGTCARGTVSNLDVLTFASITCP